MNKLVRQILVITLGCVTSIATTPSGSANDATAGQDYAVVQALLRLPAGTLDEHPEQRAAVLRFLQQHSGTREYLEVAKQLNVLEQTDEFVKLMTAVPFDTLAVEAAKMLVAAGQMNVIRETVDQSPSDQAVSVVNALGYVGNRETKELLQEVLADSNRTRQIRSAAADALGRSEAGQKILLDLALAGQVTEEIQFAVTNALLGSSNERIRTQARQVLSPPASAASETIPPVKDLQAMRGDAAAGQVVFNTVGTCNKCHRVQGQGKEIGPDLSEIGSKLSREDMFVAILNPSAAVSHNYETHTLLDVDGQITTGLLINKNDEAVTIRNAEGIDRTVALGDIETLKQQSVSLMPADLQKAMSLQNLLDLVDYMVLLRKQGEQGFNVLSESKAETPAEDPRAPSNAIAGLDIAEGLDVQLFAAEPLLLSPTSIDVDHLGRVWVCEAVNYRHFRNPYNEERSEGDRILVLEDTDGDGQADKRTVFYQGTDIDSPHGVCVLGSEVIVSAGEQVLVFTDTDGDLRADSKRPLFTGIGGVQHDHGIHTFNIGPDSKLYFNFGNEGHQLKSATGETIVDKAGNVVDDSRQPYQQGMVFRCNLDGSELETLGWNFRNNWEVCVDSYGNLWQSDNDDDGNRGTRINFVMEFGNYGYRDERTGDAWKAPRIGLESEIPLQHWHLNDPGVVPNILQTGAGSPTGMCFYEGTMLPERFQNQMIHTDPGPNVVRAYPVEADGAGFQASIVNLVQGVRDPWFRPVDVCAAPDGSLFVADWYDPGVGGHRMGDSEQGRIFRIVPQGHEGYQIPVADFGSPSTATVALMSPNLATRFLAQQALHEFGRQAESALASAAGSLVDAPMRARALWQLALINGQPHKVVEQAISDENADIRLVGIRMARQHGQDMHSIVEQLQRDPSPKVRRELLIALREVRHPRAPQLWAELALQHDGQDRWYLEALGIGSDLNRDACFQAWLNLAGDNWDTPAGRDIIWRSRSPLACQYLAKIIARTPQESDQQRYFRAFDFHEGPARTNALTQLLVTQAN